MQARNETKYGDHFVVLFLKCMDKSILVSLKCMDGSVLAYLRFAMQSAPTRFLQLDNSDVPYYAYYAYYARKAPI